MKIYVGNLSYDMTEEQLRDAFAEYGKVKSADIVMDKLTGKHRGFGFVEMENDDEAQKAIEGLNGQSVQGRNLNVNEARPREERGGRGFRGARGGRGQGGHRGDSHPSGGGGFRGGSRGDR